MRRAPLLLATAAALALGVVPASAAYYGPPALAISNALSELVAAGSQAAARANLGLGTLATQNANAAAITGGTISGLNTFGVISGASQGFGSPWGGSGQVYSSTGTASGSGSGGIGMLFDASHSIGYLGVIAPGSAWLPLNLQASTFSLLSGGSTQGLYQDGTGRVGIGTTSPGVLLDVAGVARLASYTVANLPACSSTTSGALARVSDATSPTYNGALTGGGSVAVPVFCNGSAWTAH